MTDTSRVDSQLPQAQPITGSKRLSPQLKIEPASEWANHTISALDSTGPPELNASTSGAQFPGSYPYSPTTLEPGPSFEEMKDTAKEYLCAAGQYVPSQEDVRRIAQNASTTVRGFIPDGVAAYLGPPRSTQEPIKASPIEESETTPTAAGTFVLINRGNHDVMDSTRGNHDTPHVGQDAAKQSRTFNVLDKPSSSPSGDGLNAFTNGQTDSNASTMAQPGSLAVAERIGEGHANGGATSDSYRMIEGAGDHRTRASPTQTQSALHDPTSKLQESTGNDMNGGIEKSEATVILPPHPPADAIPTGTDGAEMKAGPNDVAGAGIVNRGRAHTEQPDLSSSAEKSKFLGRNEHDNPNTQPRKYSLGKDGAQRKGAPMDQGSRVEHSESHVLAPKPSGPDIKPSGPPKEIEDDSFMKPNMAKVYSNTATAGHDDATAESPSQAAPSRFTEPPPSDAEESLPRDDSIETPQQIGAHDATHIPLIVPLDTKEAASSRKGSSRRRGGFLNKLRGWSKKFSQDRKSHN
ncbi:hypothetical protein AN958_08071 [Leucoagaricus sp. SymC.cos]|nr:hypothetical protein AN958_08071 [Leucoagaricus sp. SymC.cos]